MSDKKNKPNRPLLYYWIVGIIVLLVIRFALSPVISEDAAKEVSYSQFVTMIENDQVTEVSKDKTKYTFKAIEDGEEKIFETGLWEDTDITDRLLKAKKENSKLNFSKEIETTMNPWLTLFLTSILPLLFLWAIFYFASRSVSYTHLTLPTILRV